MAGQNDKGGTPHCFHDSVFILRWHPQAIQTITVAAVKEANLCNASSNLLSSREDFFRQPRSAPVLGRSIAGSSDGCQ